MGTFEKVCFMIMGLVITTILGSFVFMKFWAWFIAPVFDLPLMTIGQSFGLAFFLAYLKRNESSKEDPQEPKLPTSDKLGKMFVGSTVSAGLILGLGWTVHLIIT